MPQKFHAPTQGPLSAAKKKAVYARSCAGKKTGGSESDHESSDEELVEAERHHSAFEIERQLRCDLNSDWLYQNGLGGSHGRPRPRLDSMVRTFSPQVQSFCLP